MTIARTIARATSNDAFRPRRSWFNYHVQPDERHVITRRFAYATTVIDVYFWGRCARRMSDIDRHAWSDHTGPLKNRADRSCRLTTKSFPPVEPVFDWGRDGEIV